jgi:hypothetical protein
MPNEFKIIELDDDVPRVSEQMGTKPKFWYFDDTYGYCLYKEGHANTGEDWAEKVAAELCELLDIPHAVYKLAVWRGKNGVITPNFVGEREALVPGNELLFQRDPEYPKQKRFKAKKHTIQTIFDIFEPLHVQLPKEPTPPEITTAQQVFLGYLMLDAWIANTDRHHENWALIQHGENGESSKRLAPTHDHAASFGAIISEDERRKRMTTKDRGYAIESWASRGRSALFLSESDTNPLSLIEAFETASSFNPDAANVWLGKLENVTIEMVEEIFERLPEDRITDESKQFAIRVLEINRNRLLELRTT